MKSIKLLVLLLLSATIVLAQQKEGKISFTLNMTSDNEALKNQLAMLQGATLTVYYDKDFSRSETTIPMFMTNIFVYSNNSQNGLMLISGMMGKKAIKVSKQETEESETKTGNVSFTKTNETKKILGFNCTKLIAKYDDEQTADFWVTKEIIASKKVLQGISSQLEGFPLEFSSHQSGVTTKFTATKFEDNLKGENKKELFSLAIPEGYEETNMDAIKGMMGGGR